ncbi:MAG TPA: GH1 family beta-glucosidase, partial [Fimbriimonadaceae bacterium]|nr:GH1 family beta-glucosidase [Fimbriimonadaceae bacterium]
MSFRDSFVWGVSTASYQIEGAAFEGGKGPSVWDMFSHRPGATFEGHTGDVACDHYRRYKEDVALMKELGVKGYRFSLSWPRVMPDGECGVNQEGLDFYSRLVDELLKAGIEPWATLFHWDYPLALYYRGGWLNPDSPKWFAEYTQVVAESLSDRVTHWMTQNEPQVFIGLGMHQGSHAPGDKLGWKEVLLGIHHTLLAHGLSTQVLRATASKPPKIGIAPACGLSFPATTSAADIEAARQATFRVPAETTWHLAWWLDPIFLGKYPEDGLALYGDKMPRVTEEHMRLIRQPLDFLGMNVYHGTRVKAGEDGQPEVVKRAPGAPITAMKWPVEQECLYWGPKFYYERYGAPVVITENGLSNQDWVMLDGKVHDPQRIDYLHRHIGEFRKAAADGVPVEGYFQWSLLDNFEWAEGYRERFGLVYVDYPT